MRKKVNGDDVASWRKEKCLKKLSVGKNQYFLDEAAFCHSFGVDGGRLSYIVQTGEENEDATTLLS